MPDEHVGAADRGAGLRVAIVAAQFHEQLTRPLVDGAVEVLRAADVDERNITVAWTPGSFEIPVAALTLAQSGRYQAIICLGVVIRGETPHFDHVARAAARGIAEVGLRTGVPAIFGIVTADSIDQAVDRAGGRHGNRGADAARTALTMANLLPQLHRAQPQKVVRQSNIPPRHTVSRGVTRRGGPPRPPAGTGASVARPRTGVGVRRGRTPRPHRSFVGIPL